MKLRNSFIIILILITYGCGFAPIYSTKNDYNFSIEEINFTGDKVINNYLKINLLKLKNEKSTKKFKIETQTEYEKKIITKDSTGKITNYELIAEVTFTVRPQDKRFKFTEKKIMESMTDKFEEKKYEKIIKQNFSYSISNKLVTALITSK